jgi:hypothetical protein
MPIEETVMSGKPTIEEIDADVYLALVPLVEGF